ncbi:isocitrate lyase/PEP mutase family protein [Nannocystis radixulma]|uniref:Isocitrate lyase/phosphoenolpyruvate mutase family protein n=1 Tax=Nannocystis radixulma TaxID=2995305 RepID=A0ABT5B4F6_9BACT|nr:isocitrate lyase/phosphoenolpyruvate mutase family protein [Nannocystis radixulma]MDC0667956.1 isocitrate lyase/phosphoenolpyruvate mutase family protein [Nannocystis radixulma]
MNRLGSTAIGGATRAWYTSRMDISEARRRGALFRDLHAKPEIVVLPNPWDAGSARLFENLGFRGLATTSAGLAFALGRRDGDGSVSADETFTHLASLLAVTRIPITADLENGFGAAPEVVAATIRRAGELGLSGASVEDATLCDGEPLYERSLAAERICAAVEAAHALPYPFVLTARAENFVRGRPDLDDALARLEAYERAGADVLCAPFLPDERAIRLACATLTKPVHYIAGRTRFTVPELAAMGVRRVTVGASLARTALAATLRAAREILERGTFTCFDGLPSVADFNELIMPER